MVKREPQLSMLEEDALSDQRFEDEKRRDRDKEPIRSEDDANNKD